MNLAFVINPNAGAVRKDRGLPARITASVKRQASVHVTPDLDALAETARELAARDVRTVGILGGDGSASHVLTQLAKAYGDRLPRIAFIRGGTMNTVANALGVARRSPRELARRLCHAASNGHARTIARPALRVNQRLGFLFGTGVFHGFMAEYYARGDGHPTPITAATTLARCVASSLVEGGTYSRVMKSPPLTVDFSGSSATRPGENAGGSWPLAPYMTVAAGTVDQAGLGFRPFARSMREPGVFHLLAIHGTPTSVFFDLPSIWFGQGMRAKSAHEASVASARIHSDGRSFGYSIDGDLEEAPGSVELALGPTVEVLRI